MSHDNDLDNLLKPLKDLAASDLQMQKWQLATLREVRSGVKMISTTRTRWALQIVAAMFIGFIIASLFFKNGQRMSPDKSTLTAQFSSDDATFERSHANLD